MSESSVIHRDLFWTMCDTQIGLGMSRSVWSSEVLPDSVIKVEDSACNFQNVLEWETWQRVKWTDHAKWFAPCEWISPNGSVLIMKKTTPAPADKYPPKLPVFLSDTKRSNYGMIGKQFVCHDYGTHLMMERGMTKLQSKVTWTDR